MTETEQAYLAAAVGLHLPAVELIDQIDQYGEPSLSTRDDLEEAIARFEKARAAVIDEAWAQVQTETPGTKE
jgi:hypothetical protein